MRSSPSYTVAQSGGKDKVAKGPSHEKTPGGYFKVGRSAFPEEVTRLAGIRVGRGDSSLHRRFAGPARAGVSRRASIRTPAALAPHCDSPRAVSRLDSGGSGLLARPQVRHPERSQNGGLPDAVDRLLVGPYHCRSQMAGIGLDWRGHDHRRTRSVPVRRRCCRGAGRAHGFLPLLYCRPHPRLHEPLDDILGAGIVHSAAGRRVPSFRSRCQEVGMALGAVRPGCRNLADPQRYPHGLDRRRGGRLLSAVGMEKVGRDCHARPAGSGAARRARADSGARAVFDTTAWRDRFQRTTHHCLAHRLADDQSASDRRCRTRGDPETRGLLCISAGGHPSSVARRRLSASAQHLYPLRRGVRRAGRAVPDGGAGAGFGGFPACPRPAAAGALGPPLPAAGGDGLRHRHHGFRHRREEPRATRKC